jgi:hypothetical protein
VHILAARTLPAEDLLAVMQVLAPTGRALLLVTVNSEEAGP